MNDLPWFLRWVIFLLLAFPAFLLLGRAWSLYRRAARGWRSVSGRVLQTGVEETVLPVRVFTSASRYRMAARYQPVIVYEYHAENQRFEARRLFVGEVVFYSSAQDAQKALEGYPGAGEIVTVWYNPRNPAEAVLQKPLHWQFWVYVLLGFGLLGIAALLLGGG